MHCTLKGVRIHILGPEGEGRGKETALLFLHGAGGDAAVWDAQAAWFNGRRPVYRVELPGHGISSGEGESEIAAYSEWVRRIIQEALPTHDWVLVGHSMGGAVTLQLALDHPALLKGMVLAGTGAKLTVLPTIIKMLETDPQAFYKTIDLAAFCSDTPAEIREKVLKSMRSCPAPVTLKDFIACDRFDLRDRLHEIAIPALIVCGEKDRLTPVKYSEYLHHHLRSSRLVLIPGSGHMLMAENQGLFNDALEIFLGEI